MPESPRTGEWSREIVAVVERVRAEHPGVIVDVQSPTPRERDDLQLTGEYREMVIGTSGLERYVIPLRDEEFEVWRVGLVDMPGSGDLVGTHTTLRAAVDAAADAATADLDRAGRTDASTEEVDPPSRDGGGWEQPAVSNVWRSDMTAAAEVQVQALPARVVGDEPPAPLRPEEIELLDRVDPASADLFGRRGGRMDWTHRRPERATQSVPGRGLGRSVDGSD